MMRLASVALLAAMVLVAPSARALPQPVRQAMRRACGLGSLQLEGPWPFRGSTYYAAVVWREGRDRACLAMVRSTERGVETVAHGWIRAGASERYHEVYAPALRAQPVMVAGWTPMPITDATSMGGPGGGGDNTVVWIAQAGRWHQALQGTFDGATDINTVVEHPCPTPAPMVADESDATGRMLRVDQCFDGETETRVLRFDGQRFR